MEYVVLTYAMLAVLLIAYAVLEYGPREGVSFDVVTLALLAIVGPAMLALLVTTVVLVLLQNPGRPVVYVLNEAVARFRRTLGG